MAARKAPAPLLTGLIERHLRDDAWAGSAVNDATADVGDSALGAGLAAVLAAAAARRSVAALARVTVWPFRLWPAAKTAGTANPESIRTNQTRDCRRPGWPGRTRANGVRDRAQTAHRTGHSEVPIPGIPIRL
jgi:hypothetical protein